MKTEAAIYIEAGKPMIVDEIDLPDPSPDHVIVKHFATGICHSQLHNLDQPNPTLPLLLGHESTGVVTAKGRNVGHVKEGDHVTVSWVPRSAAGPTPEAAPVTYKGGPAHTAGVSGTFTWAADTIAHEQMVVPIDKGADTAATAVVACAVMTGVGAAINAAQVRPGESVAIFGVGGVGLSVVAGCAAVGAYPVIVVDLADDKLEFAKQFGATHGVNAARENPVERIRELTGGGPMAGVDYAFDAIGVKVTMEQILETARPRRRGERDGGVAVLVGVPHGPPPEIGVRMLFGGKVFRGAPGGCSEPDRDFPMLVRWFQEGKLPLNRLVTRRYTLAQINEACADLRAGKIAGRAIVEF